MDDDTTVPSRSLRGFLRASVASAIGLHLQRLSGGDLPDPHLGADSSDVALELLQAGVVVELSGDMLEPEVEQLLLRLGETLDELVVSEVTDLDRLRVRHQSASSRVTKRAFIGSFRTARSSASRATFLSGYEISTPIRPACTTATHRP